MAAKNSKKSIVYSEPDNYIPKDVYDSVFGGKSKKKPTTTKKSTTKKPTGKKK